MKRTVAVLAAVTAVTLSLGAPPASAQASLDTTLSVRGTARLSVQNMSGTVQVRAWNRSQVRVEAEYDRARVEVDGGTSRVSVRTIARRGDSEVDYRISVPAGTGVEVNGISTDVILDGVCGQVNVNVISGDVTVRCAREQATVMSVSGDVSLSDVRGPLDAGSTSGDVTLRGVQGPVNVRSVSGDIQMRDIQSDDVGAETVSGEISYDGRIADGGRYRFEAHSGDVTVGAPRNVNATVLVSTFSGDVESDFPITINPGSTRGRPPRDWEFRLGNGSARITMRSFSGTIHLRRGGAGNRED